MIKKEKRIQKIGKETKGVKKKLLILL